MAMADDGLFSRLMVLYKGFLKVFVLIPEKEIIAMLFMKTESVEYLLNASLIAIAFSRNRMKITTRLLDCQVWSRHQNLVNGNVQQRNQIPL